MNHFFQQIFKERQELTVRFDADTEAIWYYFNPTQRPCFSLTLLNELRDFFHDVTDYFNSIPRNDKPLVRYLVLASQIPGVFNLGGDLALFAKLIRNKERRRLLDYAKLCVELCYLNAINLGLPLTTISLVEGTALGGGFESAMASSVLIATDDAEMGFPEIRFNLFPGMSAYSLLARTCGIVVAEKMITSGATYTAQELYKMGIVHRVISPANTLESVNRYIRDHQRSANGRRAVQLARQRYHPVDYQELEDITKIWVEAALSLEDRDLRMMDRLVKAQSIKMTRQRKQSLLRTKQDRRFSSEEVSFPLTDWSGNIIEEDRRKDYDRRKDLDEPMVCNG